tara:strand:- start:41 stop:427 length:387 start_codon:yes stop_codon:yes gene_type:complete
MSAELIKAIYSINTNGTSALYKQVIEQTKQGIRAGLLNTGQQLPSVRAMASCLQVNPMTISKAFSQLEQQGVLERRKGIGMLVAEQHSVKAISSNVTDNLTSFISAAKAEKLNDDTILTLVQDALAAN